MKHFWGCLLFALAGCSYNEQQVSPKEVSSKYEASNLVINNVSAQAQKAEQAERLKALNRNSALPPETTLLGTNAVDVRQIPKKND